MRVNLTTLSPVHIGSSRDDILSQSVDYAVEREAVVLINHDKLQKVLVERSKGDINLEEKLINDLKEGRIQKIGDFLESNGILLDEVTATKLRFQGHIRGEIRRMINSSGRVFIPGSSIKGLFRTALAYDYLKKNFNLLRSSVERIIRTGHDPKRAFEWLNRKIFLDPNRDPLKNVLVSDTDFYLPEETAIFATSRIYLKTLRKGPPIAVEAVDKGVTNSFSLKIEPFKIFNEDFSFLENSEAWKELFKKVNVFTKALLRREIKELSGGKLNVIAGVCRSFLEQLEKLDENACIGRIGFGKTVFDETVLLLLEEYKEIHLLKQFESYLNREFWRKRRRSLGKKDPLPTTRLVTLDKYGNPEGALGWVELTIKS
jgi:CRISPR-associated protein Csm5